MFKSVCFFSVLLIGGIFPSFSQTVKTSENKTNLTCEQYVPYGFPVVLDKKDSVQICHHGYTVNFDRSAKIPNWVSYELTAFDAVGCESRSNKFVKDPLILDQPQASPNDYANSGYDKGHIAPDSDMRYDAQAEHESFYMTNMTPQLPSFNRGIWKHLEDRVRFWTVYRSDTLLIYGGPIYKIGVDKTIGDGKVVVPTGYYKIIVDTDTKESIAFLFTNQETANNDQLEQHLSNINDIEKLTQITFPVPKEMDKSTVSEMWTFQPGEYAKLKKKECVK